MPVYLLIASADAVSADDVIANYNRVDMDKALKGDSKDSLHVHWIDVTSYLIKSSGGSPSNDVLPKSGPGDVTFSRDSIDGVSPLLMRWRTAGRAPVKQPAVAIIHVVKQEQVYQELKLSDIQVSAYQTNGNDGANPGESFTLSYREMRILYYRPHMDGALDAE